MNLSRKIKWIVLLSATVFLGIGSLLLILYLALPEKIGRLAADLTGNSGYALVAGILLVVVTVIIIDLCLRLVIFPLNKLVEETALIGGVNSRHRIKNQGGPLFGPLAKAVNGIAARFEAIQQYGEEKIKSIRAVAEKERNMLAAIMAELPEGVIVCNIHGSVLLYNQQARQLLHDPQSAPEALIGLWRPVYNVIDRNQLQHALSEIQAKFRESDRNAVASFVTLGAAGQLLRVEVVPVLDHRKAYAGFILIFQDITLRMQSAGQVEGTLTSLAREIRAASAGIRAAIEAIRAYPDMERSQRDRFQEVIHKESVSLGEIIGRIDTDSCLERKTEWPLEPINAAALLDMARVKAREKLDITLQAEAATIPLFVKADTYTLTLAILFMLRRIEKENGPVPFTCRLARKENFIHLDLAWPGNPVKVEMLRGWDDCRLGVGDERLPFTFKEILRHHGAEIVAYTAAGVMGETESCLRLFLPACDAIPLGPARRVTILTQSRPEFFDFDLFGQAEPSPRIAHRLLSELNYTVFDTETTGLDPGGGDEIIALGAARIVNGRLLREERFDELVDPHRTIPPASIRIHGIHPGMIKGRPGIDQVLPRFHSYVADTILVGHNVAFDMRLLQVKESATGIRFTNPVLDTLLLSAVLHLAQSDHTMEAIAERLGVSIEGRHTAMGDAVATANIFLKMLPLLAENGILTLDDAMNASKKTLFARIKYT